MTRQATYLANAVLNRERLVQVRNAVRKLPDQGKYPHPWVGVQKSLSGRRALEAIEDCRGITRLDMSLICAESKSRDGGRCGCVIGLTATLFPEQVRREFNALAEECRQPPLGANVAKVLGLRSEQSDALLYGEGHPTAEERLETISSAEVARAIEAQLNHADAEEIWSRRPATEKEANEHDNGQPTTAGEHPVAAAQTTA